jgi:tetratricopeptide (TPR) repeat protein
MDIKRTL